MDEKSTACAEPSAVNGAKGSFDGGERALPSKARTDAEGESQSKGAGHGDREVLWAVLWDYREGDGQEGIGAFYFIHNKDGGRWTV